MSTREDIATAMNATGLVKVKPYYRQSLRPFDGFVKWNGQDQGSERIGYVNRWQVWIALPQDVVAAEKWLEQNLSTLVEALDTEVIVTSATPAELVLGDNSVNGLIIEGSLSAS